MAVGAAVAVARAAALAGGVVQLVGKVGDGRDGDAILLSVASSGVGHIAMLRDGSPVDLEMAAAPAGGAGDDDAGRDDGAADSILDRDGPDNEGSGREAAEASAPALDAGDLSLALRYLPDYRVVVIATPLEASAETAVVEAARWAGAAMIVVSANGTPPPTDVPEDATVFEAPPHDEDAAFAAMVGRYAAALDAGLAPADAFRNASASAGASRSPRDS